MFLMVKHISLLSQNDGEKAQKVSYFHLLESKEMPTQLNVGKNQKSQPTKTRLDWKCLIASLL